MSRRFTGQVLDAETGLYYYNARYYDPELGRFIQPDSTIPDLNNPQSFNRYTYVLNNPLRYNDPTGHWGQELADWWSAKVNTAAEFYGSGSSHWVWAGTVRTASTLVGGVGDLFRAGSASGAVSGNPNATKWQIAGAVATDGLRAAAIVPAAGAVGQGARAAMSSLVREGGSEVVEEVAGSAGAEVAEEPASLAPSGGCFAVGTLVQTPNGVEPIQDLKEGDLVLAYDFSESRVIERKILATINHITDYWVLVGVGGEEIKATRGHLFWIESENNWIPAADLKPGMTVRRSDGNIAAINSVKVIQLPKSDETFNLIVDTDHDYFVGRNETLVHNGGDDSTRITYTAPELDQGGSPTGKTYSGMATGTGTPQQVLNQRFSGSNHHPGQNLGDPEIDDVHDSRAQQRGREQMLHEEAGSNSSNKRNPVGPENPKKGLYNKAVQQKYGYRLKC